MASVDVVKTIMSTLSLDKKPSADKVEEKVDNFKNEFASETVEKLYLSEKMFDFEFTFDSGDRVPADRVLLSAGSDVFRSQFEGEWKGKSEGKLICASAGAFKEFLQFFYMRKVKFTMENIGEVMRLCKIYGVAQCSAICGKFLKPKVNDENVCWAYELAIMCDDKELKMFCERIIGYNATAVFNSLSFKTCSRSVISSLLEMNEMMCCSEAELFEACMSWVKCVSNHEELTKEIIEEHLGDLFYKIRFGTMPLKDISRLVLTYGSLFSTDVYKTILQMSMPGEFHSQVFCDSRQTPSKAVTWKDNDLVRCHRYVGPVLPRDKISPYLVKEIETTTFSSDIQLLLAAIQPAYLHESRLKPIQKDIPTEVTIVEIDPSNGSEKVVLPKEKAVLSHKRQTVVTLSKLIFVKPKFMYKISFEQSPPKNCSINEYLMPEVKLHQGTTVTFSGEETIDGVDGLDLGLSKISRGLVSGLQFIDNFTQSAEEQRQPAYLNHHFY